MLIHTLPSGLLLSLSASELSAAQLSPEHLTTAQVFPFLRTTLSRQGLPCPEIACVESFSNDHGVLLFIRFSTQALSFHSASVFS